jgi:hypothetical protein
MLETVDLARSHTLATSALLIPGSRRTACRILWTLRLRISIKLVLSIVSS